jgi:hypothetical protein
MEGSGIDRDTASLTERVRAIRARLPGQLLRERLETAAAWGPLYTRQDIEREVTQTLPKRFAQRRVVVLEPIETYRDRIADDALLKFGDAADSGVFSSFWIARPAYWNETQVGRPWIIGEVSGADLYAVIARSG